MDEMWRGNEAKIVALVVGVVVILGTTLFIIISHNNNVSKHDDGASVVDFWDGNDDYEEPNNVDTFVEDDYQEPEENYIDYGTVVDDNDSMNFVEDQNDDYIFPDSSYRYIEEYELNNLSEFELSIARNEIYARKGRKFTTSQIQNYFDSKSWYYGYIEPDAFTENMLNDYERANTVTILNYEKRMGYR